MARPNILKNPTTISLIIEYEQIQKLNKLVGNGKVSEYIRDLIDTDKGQLKPYQDIIKTQEETIQSYDKIITELKSDMVRLQGENIRLKEELKDNPKTKKEEIIKISSMNIAKCGFCGTNNLVSKINGKRMCINCGRMFEYNLSKLPTKVI